MKGFYPVSALIAVFVPSIGAAALAESSKFTRAEIKVIRAGQFVNERNGHSFRTRQDLQFTVRSSPFAKRVAARGVQARIFRLDGAATLPGVWAIFEPCLVFYSVVLNAPLKNGRINLGGLGRLNFLTVAGGRVSKGRFLIVFEEKTDNRGTMMRLERNHVATYFSQAIYIEVLPAETFSSPDIAGREAQLSQQSSALAREARTNSPTYRCYRYRAAEVGSRRASQLAYLQQCEMPAPSPTKYLGGVVGRAGLAGL